MATENLAAYLLIFFPLIIGGLVLREIFVVARHIGKSPFVVFHEGNLAEKITVVGIFSWGLIQIVFGVSLFLGWQPRLLFKPSSAFFWIAIFLLVVGCFIYQVAASAMGIAYRIGIDRGQQANLVFGGIYRFIRHPIYSAVFAFLLGVFLIFPHRFFLLSLVLGSFGIYRQAISEEKFLEETCGEDYLRYKNQTGRFLPKLWGK